MPSSTKPMLKARPSKPRFAKPGSRFESGEQEPPKPLSAESLRGKALALLTFREHSQAELREKLLEKGGEAEAIEALLDDLAQSGLQSDERFADVFVRNRFVRGKGPQVIRSELKARGLNTESATEALTESGCDWLAHAAAIRERRFGTELPTEQKEKARQMRFLQYRGFTGAQIGRVFRGVTGDDD